MTRRTKKKLDTIAFTEALLALAGVLAWLFATLPHGPFELSKMRLLMYRAGPGSTTFMHSWARDREIGFFDYSDRLLGGIR